VSTVSLAFVGLLPSTSICGTRRHRRRGQFLKKVQFGSISSPEFSKKQNCISIFKIKKEILLDEQKKPQPFYVRAHARPPLPDGSF
jgi:hypothetical protein